ncbi:hypothetical protein IL38_21385 [Actinopolyspora erythraea]|uniref:VOC domain-containing protein n=1 Tax=Actinopolyspora erythraea TaxID=414996 RepID=A0ABR4X043_9ACTN|nr:hypothetical protein IL38_21385 [Actinopolyspora erythraea]
MLARLRADGGPAWSVFEIQPAEDKVPPLRAPGDVKHLSITLGDASSHEDPVGVYFTVGPPLIDAIIATTDQIQEHMLEATQGALLPACPGHQHPLQVAERDGVAMWLCPQAPAHYAEPVLPQGTTG